MHSVSSDIVSARIELNLLPERAFAAISSHPMPFWLDSAMPHPIYGRWSYLGCDPFLTLAIKNGRIVIRDHSQELVVSGNPFDYVRHLLAQYRLPASGGPTPFTCGAVGYFGYDMGHYLEDLPSRAEDDLRLPDCVIGFYDTILAFDHVTDKAFIVSTGFPESDLSRRSRRAHERCEWMLDLVRSRAVVLPPVAGYGSDLSELRSAKGERLAVTPRSNFTPDQYQTAVERVREYIIAGDVFEVNLSQRFSAPIRQTPVELYRRLRAINPAPFSCYLGCEGFSVVSSSPERFLSKRGTLLESRPIKGTRKRGTTLREDRANASELLVSAKDRAENVMIVDLVRNDLGRVCEYGSIQVTGLAELETLPSVYHLTSTVQGRLRSNHDTIDAITALFPGGSITGAPKIRAMEIIDELEPTRRGVYTGSIGWIGFNGDCDFNIAIRTMVVKDGIACYQAGGAIVYDSDPEQEYIETLHKAKALTETLGEPIVEVS